MKIVVYHRMYGCDTGCCGHAITVDGEEVAESFAFSHPDSNSDEDKLSFAREMVYDQFGAEHVADLDWENSFVVDD